MNNNTANLVACQICIAKKGLTLNSDYLFKTLEELNDHLEVVHHKPVIQKGETEKEAIKRFLKKYPEAKDCSDCREAGATWVDD